MQSKKHVLVIDDDNAVHFAFQTALQNTSCEVTVASDGETGLEHARARPPDVIFLDLKMPGIDGVETLHRLRASGCTTPVYIVTAFADDFLSSLRAAAADMLDFDLLRKPLSRDQIRMITANALTIDLNGIPCGSFGSSNPDSSDPSNLA